MNKEEELIAKGKEWMSKSVNATHDYEHAESVAKHGLRVFKSLQKEDWFNDQEVDENLVLIAAWWHDSYKALYSKKTVIGEFREGFGSAKIFKNYAKDFLPERRLSMVVSAIKHHNNFLYFFLKGKKLPILTRALIEADAISAQDSLRKKKDNLQDRTFFHGVLSFFSEPFFDIIQRGYIKSSYAKIKIAELKQKENGNKA